MEYKSYDEHLDEVHNQELDDEIEAEIQERILKDHNVLMQIKD